MGWRTTGDVAEFLGVAGGHLRQERARNTVLLTVTEQLRVNPAPKPAPAAPTQAAAAAADPARLPLFGSHFPCPGLLAGSFAFPGRGGILKALC